MVLMMADTDIKDKISMQEMDYNNEKYICVIMNNKIDSSKKFNILKVIVSNILNRSGQLDYLYVNERYNIENDIILSKRIGIKIRKIDKKTKIDFITYNFFKIKDLIKQQGYDKFCKQYKIATHNETLDKIYYKVEHKIITSTIDEYFYISTIKNIIHIYKKEVNNNINYNDPSFSDKMLFKYLDNYFSKFIIIDYDKNEVKKFISKYYVNENQAEDLTYSFVNNFLSFYKIITTMNFSYKNSYDINLKELSVFNYKKASRIKYKDFYKYFDNLVEDDKNYYDFMFIIEMLELTKHNSNKKDIIDYISIFELLLVKRDKNISNQIQNKCMNFLDKSYSENEFKLMYDYRSKIIHGDYEKSINKLREISLLKKYEITNEELQDDTYSNINQLLEEKVRNSLFNALVIILRCFVFNNQKIKLVKGF